MLNGKVTDAEYAYQRIAYVRPVEHHYGNGGEQPYIKYGCPVCELLNNKHQVTFGSDNCPLCNVNLLWEEPINSNEMRIYEAIYGMGGMATGGYFKSLVAADSKENVAGLLCEEHDEEVLITSVDETDKKSEYTHEHVLTTERI